MAELDCLQFTMEVWSKDDDFTIKNEKLTYVDEQYFPYLDMEMYWNGSNELKLQVLLKSNQKLKYLNNDSIHLPTVFKAIPSGELERLGKLTTKSKKLEKIRVNKIYPLYCQALKTAGIAPKVFLTFLQLGNLRNKRTTEENRTKRKRKRRKGIDKLSFV